MGDLEVFNHQKHSNYRAFSEVYFEIMGCKLQYGLNEFKFVNNSSYGTRIFRIEHLSTVNVDYKDIKENFRKTMEARGVKPVMGAGYRYPVEEVESFLLEYFEGVEQSIDSRLDNFVYEHGVEVSVDTDDDES
jgi:hypothetical protein